MWVRLYDENAEEKEAVHVLDKMSKHVLDHLLSQEKEHGYFFLSSKELINSEVGLNTVFEVNRAIDKLVSLGLVTFGDADAEFIDNNRIEVRLRQDGKVYDEYLRNKRKEFWLKSVLVPIGVSVATSVTTFFVMQLISS